MNYPSGHQAPAWGSNGLQAPADGFQAGWQEPAIDCIPWEDPGEEEEYSLIVAFRSAKVARMDAPFADSL